MGSNASSQRRKSEGRQSQQLERGQPQRRSLRSFSRKSAEKIPRASSNQSLPVTSRPVTLCNSSEADELADGRQMRLTRSAATADPVPDTPTRATVKTPVKSSADSPSRGSRMSMMDSPTRQSSALRDRRSSGRAAAAEDKSLNSPFSVITSQEVLDTDDDYRTVSDFLVKHYATPDGQRSLTRVCRLNERLNATETPSPRTAAERRSQQPAGRSSFSLCDMECNRSHANAKDELNELNTIDYKLKCLMCPDRSRNLSQSLESGDRKPFKVSFTLSNGSEQETHLVSLPKASLLIAERKSYLEKKIELEFSHCQRVKEILCSSPAACSGSQPVTPNCKAAVTLTSTPSFSKTRKPRALSLIESADGIVGLDSSSYANLMQDVKDVKTLLFRLQGMIHVAESDEQRRNYLNYKDDDDVSDALEEKKQQLADMQQELREVQEIRSFLTLREENTRLCSGKYGTKSDTKTTNGRGNSGSSFES